MELLYTVQKPKSTTIADPADFFAYVTAVVVVEQVNKSNSQFSQITE